jgi:hypothetical protein
MDSTHRRTRRTDQPPTIREIAALTARLRGLTGPDVDPAERAAFLADKAALLARIHHLTSHESTGRPDAVAATRRGGGAR